MTSSTAAQSKRQPVGANAIAMPDEPPGRGEHLREAEAKDDGEEDRQVCPSRALVPMGRRRDAKSP